jgi:hypothetical protein
MHGFLLSLIFLGWNRYDLAEPDVHYVFVVCFSK